MDKKAVTALMMQRQCLLCKARIEKEYEALFRLMQPVPPVYFSCPGDPPVLAHRAAFDDAAWNDGLRASRTIVKGRFLGGTVGYVYADELELYAAAFRRDIGPPTYRQQRLLDLLMGAGPLTCAQMKEETGLLVKEIMPDLHRLQEAFLVYEDQTDGDWERGWYVFAREWDGVDVNRYEKAEAVAEVLKRFLRLNVFASIDGMKGWFRLPARELRESLLLLHGRGEAVPAKLDGERGWMLAEDFGLLAQGGLPDMEPSVFVLHRADFLVRSHEYRLKNRFGGLEVLQYILVDGDFRGAVLGHWRQGPHDVEDVALMLPEEEKARRKREILDAVAVRYSPPFSFIQRYDGKELDVSHDDA